MARENASWGYTRIRDAMGNLGHVIGRTTVQDILNEHGIEPAPQRRKRISWKAFLKAHWDVIAACDFFTVEVLTFSGLRRYYVFFVLELRTRRVDIAGIIHQPYGQWMVQVARNLTDAEDGFLKDKRYLILDRDPLYTAEFRKLLRASGVEPLRLPTRSPNLNAYAERFVLSIKSECLNRLVLVSVGQLRTAVRQYVAHYHAERNHQGLGGRLIEPPSNDNTSGAIDCHERLGGLLRFYYRSAA